jgi:hypothetical protein
MPKILPNPDEVLDDVLSLCAKACVDHDGTGRVSMVTLLAIRDNVNALRTHIAGGGGYKSLPRIIPPSSEEA